MPRIDIRHPHRLPPAEARATVDRIASRMQEKFGLAGRWEGDAFGFARQGVKGTIAVGADEVRVSAELGMLLGPLRGTIEQEIRRKLDEYFGPAA
ncbi:polyhydroxyalkanoic acid system family protein [Fulvimonas soli]|uniref:Putative polyhydroxyalkanoate system protein n=1 Tax=Fulvimonas soli TaxID=155197 RepID=A0A316IBI8_9GAMM|nr:polyhydroxyalkanoic acid system family protein [Fulvimonas soli]PWK89872.1 putative polyhydroxyalkanoate system protein [Fulvimonas soli]TNY27491.1 polyhydroxyalkanoic acid synthase [Fulvimonas soli]